MLGSRWRPENPGQYWLLAGATPVSTSRKQVPHTQSAFFNRLLGRELICSARPGPSRIVGGGIAGRGAGSPASEAAATLAAAESRTLHARSSTTIALVSGTCYRAMRASGSLGSTKTPPRGDIRQQHRVSRSAPESPRLTADRVRDESGRHTIRPDLSRLFAV